MASTGTSSLLVPLVFAGGIATGAAGLAVFRFETAGNDAPRRPTDVGQAPSAGDVPARQWEREELKRALRDLGLRVDDETDRARVVAAPAGDEFEELEFSTYGDEVALADVLARLETSYRAGLTPSSRSDSEAVASAIGDAEERAAEEGASARDVALPGSPEAEAAPVTSRIDEPRVEDHRVENHYVETHRVETHVETHVVNQVQQVTVYQPIFLPSYGAAPAPRPTSRPRERAPDASPFRPVDLNAHYVNPFSAPPPWVAR